MKLQQYDRVRARFAPKRTDDLQNSAERAIGKVGVFEAYWVIGEDDGHVPYHGQWAMGPVYSDPSSKQFDFAWVPECDLEILEMVRKFPWESDGGKP